VTTLSHITKFIQNERRREKSYSQIGEILGVCAAEVKRLESGKYPGPKVARRLGLVEKCPNCHRRILKPKAYKRLFDVPKSELLRRLQDRSEF
jgi:hypothetical protein